MGGKGGGLEGRLLGEGEGQFTRVEFLIHSANSLIGFGGRILK